MKFVANKSLSTMSLIAIELSKAYLYRALSCEDSDSDSIYCLANVYLAVLYYITGQYRKATRHCTLVTNSQNHLQCRSHVVQGELLPKIDDDVGNVLGLAVFYQHLRATALNQQHQTQHVSVLTTELFAYYLNIKCLPLTMCCLFTQISPPTDEFRRYETYISDTAQLLIGDVLLLVSLKQKSYHEPIFQQSHQLTTNPTKHCTSHLVELLQKSAVEHLTEFRHLEAREFGSVVTIATTDFEALYAYKRGDCRRCLQLSRRNVHALLNADEMPDVPTFPEFIQLLDDDIVSLTALTLIANRTCRDYSSCVCIYQLTLSLYLMTQCQLKLRRPVAALARTLGYIVQVSHRRYPVERSLDRLILKMIAHRALISIATMMN